MTMSNTTQKVLQLFRLFAAEFTDMDDAIVNTWIELTMPMVDCKQFASLYEQAVAYLTAHRIKMSQKSDGEAANDGNGGIAGISSYSEGGVSISYNTPNLTQLERQEEATIYGLQYLAIREQMVTSVVI